MDLKTIILAEIRERIADEKGYKQWDSFRDTVSEKQWLYADHRAHKESYDRLDAVYRWASGNNYSWSRRLSIWYKREGGTLELTDAQLYTLYQQSQTKSE